MNIKVLYFAQLAECRSKETETLETAAKTVEALYLDLKKQYQFPLEVNRIQFAVNHEMTFSGYELKEGDEVVFLPPMTGG